MRFSRFLFSFALLVLAVMCFLMVGKVLSVPKYVAALGLEPDSWVKFVGVGLVCLFAGLFGMADSLEE